MSRAISKWEIRITTLLIAGAMTIPLAPADAAEKKASVVLETLAVKGRAPKTGYDRSSFGGWADLDNDSCYTRDEILMRDLQSVTFDPEEKCQVQSGTFIDPYSGTRIDFLQGRGTSNLVQIDHVVAVSDAWQKGAFKWGSATKISFYNDPLNLLAVQGRLNSQKGDGDAATWLPPLKSYRCNYVARQIAVKAKYSIWVTTAEKAAMKAILAKCPGQLLPRN
jgi:hypothetical protein